MTYRLGRTVWHDEASRAFPAAAAGALSTVTHLHRGPVLDQGDLGSCTGNAAVAALNTEPLFDGSRRLLDERDAIAVYAQATALDPFPGGFPPEDTGSSGLAVAKVLRRAGLIRQYRHAFGVEHALAALVRAPVIIGIPWYQGMFTPDGGGYVTPSGQVAGGHEVCLIGLDVDRRDVLAVNSWGSGWGQGGFFRLTWDDLGRLLAERGDATVLVP